mmetsp:Transcript_22457/g.52373  ORF Transcript_22457/g.52373 Transcript_22457/m.52373 type:complete len:100 (-) Transcript_22457:201-500(-)
MRSFVVKLALLAAFFCVATAVLPPGYEDNLFCPPGYCVRTRSTPPGFVGPRTAFNECYKATDGTIMPVTPWGFQVGQEKLRELKAGGYTETKCQETREL